MKRPLRIGAAIAIAYLVIATITVQFADLPAMPLFDGVGPPPSYQWVKPPTQFAAGNVKPKAISKTIDLDANGNQSENISTSDGQIVVSLSAGAIPPRAGASKAMVTLTPLDPARLAPLPKPFTADGNAYRVAVSYLHGPRLRQLAKSSSLLLVLPVATDGLVYHSADGKQWARITAPPTHAASVAVQTTALGIFAAGVRPTSGSANNNPPAWVIIVALLLAAASVAAGIVYWRRQTTPRRRKVQQRNARRGLRR